MCLPTATSTIFGVVPISLPSTRSKAPCGTEFTVTETVRDVFVRDTVKEAGVRCRKRDLKFDGLARTNISEVNVAFADTSFVFVEDVKRKSCAPNGLVGEVLRDSVGNVRVFPSHSAHFLKFRKSETQGWL